MHATPIPSHLPRLAERFDMPDSEIRDKAERLALSVLRQELRWDRNADASEADRIRSLRRLAKRHQVAFPNYRTHREIANRMRDPQWWRRQLRTRFRAVELHAIQGGQVHAKTSPHVSRKALLRQLRHGERLAEQMDALEVVNETTGEAIPMSEIRERSLANPTMRRNALMARMKGIDLHAQSKGDVGLFLTITCPSRMHPWHSSGQANTRYDGTYPAKAQKHLSKVWRLALREAAHAGIKPYGLRTVEAHHDACPHWHVLAFLPQEQAEDFARIVRRHALRSDPNEPGASERRFTLKAIDPTKGSAVGYVAKYVSKCVDGHGVEQHDESELDGAQTALRQVAWSRIWSIRQFQFFGLPPITPLRELYRVDGAGLAVAGEGVMELHGACKANDYAAYLAALEHHGIELGTTYQLRNSTRYEDEQSRALSGIEIQGGALVAPMQIETRTEQWRIQRRAAAHQAGPEGESNAQCCTPWTRINNCAALDSQGNFAGKSSPREGPTANKEEGVSHTGHRYPVQDGAKEKSARTQLSERPS